MGKKIADERALRAAVEANPELKAKVGGAWERLSASRAVARTFYPRYIALGGGGMNFGSETFAIAKNLTRMAAEQSVPDSKRLREYRDSARSTLEIGLFSPAPIDRGMEIDALSSALMRMAEVLGSEDPTVLAAFDGKSPRARAEELIAGTKLFDVAERKRLAQGGAAAIAASTDPLIQLVRTLDPEARALRKKWEDEVDSVERECYAQIAEARFAIDGDKTYPDATFTLRLSFGQVLPYQENGVTVDEPDPGEGRAQHARTARGRAPASARPRDRRGAGQGPHRIGGRRSPLARAIVASSSSAGSGRSGGTWRASSSTGAS
jgi:hypothetical protein